MFWFCSGSDPAKFLYTLASTVSSIDIRIAESGFTSPYVVPIIKEMMERKCNTLRFEDEQFPISLSETEKLVQVNLLPPRNSNTPFQFVHHIERKVSISVGSILMDPIYDTVVGEYYLRTIERDMVAIEHVQRIIKD